MQVTGTHIARISNRLYYIVLDLRNIDKVEQQSVNSIVQAKIKSKSIKRDNINRRL